MSKNTNYEFNIAKANKLLDEAGWKPGSDGVREKDGKKLKFVYQTSINAPRQKTQEIVKQACQKAGIAIELKSVTASVFFSSDVANPDTYTHFYCDLQMYTTTMSQPDPGSVHAPVPVVGGRDQGQQVAGPQYHALAERGIRRAVSTRRENELDPVKRAAMFIKMNDMVVKRRGGHPGRLPAQRVGGGQQAERAAERLGQRLLALAGLVSRGVSVERRAGDAPDPRTAGRRGRAHADRSVSHVSAISSGAC